MIDLRHGDCLELMRDIPDGSVDLVLCDLPYGTTNCAWDSVIPFAPLWENWHRVCKEDAAVVLFCQFPFAGKVFSSNESEFRYEWIWEKDRATGFLNANKMPMKAHENLLVFYRKMPNYHPQWSYGKPYRSFRGKRTVAVYGQFGEAKTESDGRRYPRDILSFRRVGVIDENLHPTQKPVALLEYLIKTYTDAGETVLDNTMGSGSTGVACVNTGRSFIGIEKDDRYFEVARKRIEDAERERKGSLFDMDALDAETERRERESWLFEEEE